MEKSDKAKKLSLSQPPPSLSLFKKLNLHSRRSVSRKCGIIGIHKASGPASVELYEGLLMLQHRGQDSAGMVTVR